MVVLYYFNLFILSVVLKREFGFLQNHDNGQETEKAMPKITNNQICNKSMELEILFLNKNRSIGLDWISY